MQWTLAHKLPHAAQTGSIEFVYTGIYAFLSLFLPKMVSLEQVLEKKQFQFNQIQKNVSVSVSSSLFSDLLSQTKSAEQQIKTRQK